jgi:hypothetical protein
MFSGMHFFKQDKFVQLSIYFLDLFVTEETDKTEETEESNDYFTTF